MLKIKRLHDDATLPTRAYPTDAGLDIYASEDVEIPASEVEMFSFRKHNDLDHFYLQAIKKGEPVKINPNRFTVSIGQARIPTGIAVEIPEGHYGKVSSRSGLAFKHGIFSFDGTIDASYRGEIGVLLYNTKDEPYQVKKGDRIAQLLIIPCAILKPVEVSELTSSRREDKGFGSSGK